jgi:hypothetical protein
MSTLNFKKWDAAGVAGWEAAQQKAAEVLNETGEEMPEWVVEGWAYDFAHKFFAEMRKPRCHNQGPNWDIPADEAE